MSAARSTDSVLLAREHVVERLAFEQLHREVQPAIGDPAEVVDLDDVLVVDLGDRRRLAPEPLDREVVARQLVVEHLDRDLAPQRHVLRAIDRAGSALPDQLLDQEPITEELADKGIGRALCAQLGPAAVRAEQRVLRICVLAAFAGDRRRGHVMSGHKSPDGRPKTMIARDAWPEQSPCLRYDLSDFLRVSASSASVTTPFFTSRAQSAANLASMSGSDSSTSSMGSAP